MTPGRKIAAGIALLLAGIWFHAWAWQFAKGTWADVPTFITGALVITVGSIIAVVGAAERDP